MRKLATVLVLATAPVFAQTPMQGQGMQGEGMRGQGQMPDMAAMFMRQFDADENGKVTMAEFIQPSQERLEQQFKEMDSNGDGVIDRQEIDKVAEMMRQRMEQMRQQGSGMQRR